MKGRKKMALNTSDQKLYEIFFKNWVSNHVPEEIVEETKGIYADRPEEEAGMSWENFIQEYGFYGDNSKPMSCDEFAHNGLKVYQLASDIYEFLAPLEHDLPFDDRVYYVQKSYAEGVIALVDDIYDKSGEVSDVINSYINEFKTSLDAAGDSFVEAHWLLDRIDFLQEDLSETKFAEREIFYQAYFDGVDNIENNFDTYDYTLKLVCRELCELVVDPSKCGEIMAFSPLGEDGTPFATDVEYRDAIYQDAADYNWAKNFTQRLANSIVGYLAFADSTEFSEQMLKFRETVLNCRENADSFVYNNLLFKPQETIDLLRSADGRAKDEQYKSMAQHTAWLDKIVDNINKHYEEIYQKETSGAITQKEHTDLRYAMNIGDAFLKTNHPIMLPLLDKYNDMFTSDRELKALALALRDTGIFEEWGKQPINVIEKGVVALDSINNMRFTLANNIEKAMETAIPKLMESSKQTPVQTVRQESTETKLLNNLGIDVSTIVETAKKAQTVMDCLHDFLVEHGHLEEAKEYAKDLSPLVQEAMQGREADITYGENGIATAIGSAYIEALQEKIGGDMTLADYGIDVSGYADGDVALSLSVIKNGKRDYIKVTPDNKDALLKFIDTDNEKQRSVMERND